MFVRRSWVLFGRGVARYFNFIGWRFEELCRLRETGKCVFISDSCVCKTNLDIQYRTLNGRGRI